MKIQKHQYNYQSQNVQYSGGQLNDGWIFDYNISPLMISTKSFPQTLEIIKRMVPGVLETECFNDHNFLFVEEIKNTEIGHLFEHIVIYLLKENGIKNQQNNRVDEVVYEGRTYWNWKKIPEVNFLLKSTAHK